MSLTAIHEGITLQRVGELIFDVGTVPAHRASSRKSYIRALDDLTFSLLFAQKVATTGDFPLIGRDRPGQLLVEDFPDRFLQLQRRTEPQELLEDVKERPYLKDLVGSLWRGYQRETVLWRDHMLREAKYNLGNDASLFKIHRKPDAYRFKKNFWPDRGLQDLVPHSFVEAILHLIAPVVNARIKAAALIEFITRNAVAHVVIFDWYQLGFGSSFNRGDYVTVPWGTRAALLATSGAHRRHDRLPTLQRSEELWQIRRLVMPYVLTDLLNRSLDRADFWRNLKELAMGNEYRPSRQQLSAAIAEFISGDKRALSLAVGELRRATQRTGSSERIAIADRLPLVGPAERNRIITGPNWLVPVLRRRRTSVTYGDVESATLRVFPELAD